MALGPFITYVPPGVYTRTLTEANVANLVAGLRIPVYIGVGQEELEQSDLELVRGSSSTLDQQIINEDVSLSFVLDETNPSNPILGAANGTAAKFRVRNYPIVDGQGFGRTTNNVRSVRCTLNGDEVAVGSVQGANGYVTLQVPPQPGDDVRCTYYFHRSDTAFTDDVSEQITSTQAILTAPAAAAYDIVLDTTDTFELYVDPQQSVSFLTPSTVTFTAGSHTAASLKNQIDAAAITGLVTSVWTDNEGNDHLRLTAAQEIVIGGGNANGALGFTEGANSGRNKNFRVFQRPVVDGSDGGITTTDTSKITVMVNSVQVIPTALDGTNGIVTLPFPPSNGSTVTIAYWHNTWQDTFDYLPNSLVTTIERCGFSPGRNDYLNEQDFVISNPTPDVSIIHWGASYVVASTGRTPGAEVFDDTQIIPTLVDDQLFAVECERFVNTTVVPAAISPNVFTLPEIPTTGNGRDTPLGSALYNAVTNSRVGLNTNRPDLITAIHGRDYYDAMGRAAATVVEVDAATRRVTVAETIPPDHNLYCTFYYSRLRDDTYILTNKVAGAVGTGRYEVFSTLENANKYQVLFGTKTGLPETVQWPRGVETVPDALHTGAGTAIAEEVTVTFGSTVATNAKFTTDGSCPYDFYAGTSDQWRMTINGNPHVVDLDNPFLGQLVSGHIATSGGSLVATITTGVNDEINLTIDGTPNDIDVTLTTGLPNPTPANIVTDINAAIDAADFSGVGGIDFTATAPNALASTVAVGDVSFLIIESLTASSGLPDAFDELTTLGVALRQSNGAGALGFTPFQAAYTTPTATNKPATLVGTEPGTFDITAGVNDEFKVRFDGVDYTVALTTGANITPATIVGDINGVLPGTPASVGTLANLDCIRLTSSLTNPSSQVTILDGIANDTLGFSQGDSAGNTQVTCQEVVNAIIGTAGVIADGIAYVETIEGSDFVTLESLTTGATTSSVAFTSGANSAFNTDTGTGIEAGTSGDNGEDAEDNYVVTSNQAGGSAGTGIPGQTYTDDTTGLRFTVLPSATGGYTGGGSFTMDVSPTWEVTPVVPSLALGGLETIVSDTVNVGVGDTATIQTFDPGGLEPAVGDFYFLTYRFLKQDYSTRLYQQLKNIEANFGPLSAENRVTLAAYLAILNGAVLVGIKQVLKVTNTNQASDQSFQEAITELQIPLAGNVRPDVLVPLTTSTAIYSFLMQHVETMSNIRNQSERIGFIGFASGTVPSTAQAVAKGLLSNRIIAVYPDSAVITLTNELGEAFETLVDGTFLAAAVAGAVVSPAVDVATPYTRRIIQGFTRLPRIMDPVEANQTATSGITVLEELEPFIRIKQGLTTDISTILTRLPTVVQIADFVQQQSRNALDVFVGTKFLSTRTNEVEVSMTALFKSLVQAEIIGAWTGISAEIDPDDPTILRFEAYFQPIFPLLYLVLTFNLRASI